MSSVFRRAWPGVAAVLWLVLGTRAVAGVAPPRPGEIDAKDIDPEKFTSDQLFNARWDNKPYTGPLAKCPVCGRPLKDHVDGRTPCQAPNAHAAALGRDATSCPVCFLKFRAPRPDPDPRGGLDHDFCRHPRGLYSLASEIVLCPRCGYAAPFARFAEPVDEKTREFVKSKVTAATMKFLEALVGFKPKNFKFKDFSFLDPAYIPEHLKYENAVAVASAAGAEDLAIARLHLGASHAYRRLVNRPFREAGLDKAIRRVEAMLVDPLVTDEADPVSVAGAARSILARSESEDALASEKLKRRDRLYLMMRLAGLHDRLGEPWWAEHYVKQAWELATKENEPKTRDAYTGLVRNAGDFLRREMHHQAQAAARFRRALAAGKVPGEELLVTVYLTGELLARTGELKRALPWLSEAEARASRAGVPELLPVEWPRSRITSPAFREGDDRKLIAPDPEERDLVARIATGVPVELPADAPPPAGAANAESPGATAEGQVPPPSAVPEPGPDTAPDAPRPDAAPKTCREQMARVWRAIDAYRQARGAFPPKLEALVESGLVSNDEVAGFVCVESGTRLFYRTPPAGGVTFILFHSGPSTCPCKNMLLSDGSVVEFGKWRP